MSNEIKQGDKVRVSKDAPKVYLSSVNNLFKYHVCKVEDVDGDSAIISYTDIGIDRWLDIPTKYLIKVDAEAKEAKFKVGDVVRIKPTADKLHQGYQNGYAWLPERDEYLGRVASVKEIWCDGSIILSIRNNMLWEPIDLEPYTEPTEQTEVEEDARIRQMEAELDELRKAELDRILHPEKPTFEITIDEVAMGWRSYEADLAKEIALKVANKYSDPKEAADYAVSVAKSVVEGLKRK